MTRPIRLLEVGCGTGRNLRPFLRGEFRVFAVDIDQDAMATARSLMPEPVSPAGPFFSAAHAAALPFRDGAFDTVLCVNLLHWARNAEAFETWWREFWRMLKPGGIFYATFRCRSAQDEGRDGERSAGWFLTNRDDVAALTGLLNGEWIEPWTVSKLKGGGWQGNAVLRRRN